MAAFKHAIFFDNDPKNIKRVRELCPSITCVSIPETADIKERSWKDPIMERYLEQLGKPNIYVNAIQTILRGDTYDEKCGIQQVHIDTLNTWITRLPKGESAAIIFDWDRTITMVEGIVRFSRISSVEDDYYKMMEMTSDKDTFRTKFRTHMCAYIFGGMERFKMIRRLFKDIYDNGHEIFILTNNGACGSDDLYSYIKLLSPLLPNYKPKISFENMLCSGDTTKYKGDKGLLLKEHSRFKGLCPDAAPPSETMENNARSRKRRCRRRRTIRRR
jgi:hypothetical protein